MIKNLKVVITEPSERTLPPMDGRKTLRRNRPFRKFPVEDSLSKSLFAKSIEIQKQDRDDNEEENLKKSDADDEKEAENSIAMFVKEKGVVSASMFFNSKEQDMGYASQA